MRDGRLIEASAGQLDRAFERAPIGMALFPTDGRYVRVDDELCRMLGRLEDDLLEDGRPALEARLREALRSTSGVERDDVSGRRDGGRSW